VRKNGEIPKVMKLTKEEFEKEMKKKLQEEVQKLTNSNETNIEEEIADIYEVLESLIRELDLDEGKVQEIKEKKLENQNHLSVAPTWNRWRQMLTSSSNTTSKIRTITPGYPSTKGKLSPQGELSNHIFQELCKLKTLLIQGNVNLDV